MTISYYNISTVVHNNIIQYEAVKCVELLLLREV